MKVDKIGRITFRNLWGKRHTQRISGEAEQTRPSPWPLCESQLLYLLNRSGIKCVGNRGKYICCLVSKSAHEICLLSSIKPRNGRTNLLNQCRQLAILFLPITGVFDALLWSIDFGIGKRNRLNPA